MQSELDYFMILLGGVYKSFATQRKFSFSFLLLKASFHRSLEKEKPSTMWKAL
jgi:hypothetical protein